MARGEALALSLPAPFTALGALHAATARTAATADVTLVLMLTGQLKEVKFELPHPHCLLQQDWLL